MFVFGAGWDPLLLRSGWHDLLPSAASKSFSHALTEPPVLEDFTFERGFTLPAIGLSVEKLNARRCVQLLNDQWPFKLNSQNSQLFQEPQWVSQWKEIGKAKLWERNKILKLDASGPNDPDVVVLLFCQRCFRCALSSLIFFGGSLVLGGWHRRCNIRVSQRGNTKFQPDSRLLLDWSLVRLRCQRRRSEVFSMSTWVELWEFMLNGGWEVVAEALRLALDMLKSKTDCVCFMFFQLFNWQECSTSGTWLKLQMSSRRHWPLAYLQIRTSSRPAEFFFPHQDCSWQHLVNEKKKVPLVCSKLVVIES